MSDVQWACQEQLAALEQAVLDAERALLLVAERAQILQDCLDEHSEDPPSPGPPVGAKVDPVVDAVVDAIATDPVHPLILLAERVGRLKTKAHQLEMQMRAMK